MNEDFSYEDFIAAFIQSELNKIIAMIDQLPCYAKRCVCGERHTSYRCPTHNPDTGKLKVWRKGRKRKPALEARQAD